MVAENKTIEVSVVSKKSRTAPVNSVDSAFNVSIAVPHHRSVINFDTDTLTLKLLISDVLAGVEVLRAKAVLGGEKRLEIKCDYLEILDVIRSSMLRTLHRST